MADWRQVWSGEKGFLEKYACAFGDVEASYKTFSLAWYRLDLKERQARLTYWISPKHVLSYGGWNFRLIGLFSDLESLNSQR